MVGTVSHRIPLKFWNAWYLVARELVGYWVIPNRAPRTLITKESWVDTSNTFHYNPLESFQPCFKNAPSSRNLV